MIELGPRPGEDLPGLVTVLADDDEIVGGGAARRRQGLVRAPAMTVYHPESASAAGDEGEGGGAAGVLHHGDGFAGEDVRVA